MFLSLSENFRYKQLKTRLKNNYILGMYGYPQYPPGVVKILNNYITENENNRNFRKISGKDQVGVAFTQTQEKGVKENRRTKIKGESHFFSCGNKYCWEVECPNLEEEQQGQLHTNVGTGKEDVENEIYTLGVSSSKITRIPRPEKYHTQTTYNWTAVPHII